MRTAQYMLTSTKITHNISHTLKNTPNSYKISITIIEVHEKSRNPRRVQGWGGEPLTKQWQASM